MKATISELMDGELDEHAAGQSLSALGRERELFDAWRTYHLISDALQDTPPLSRAFHRRFSERLAQEPTVLAPGRIPRLKERVQWVALSAAASVAAVALVGWLAFSPAPDALQAPLASAPQEAAAPVAARDVARVPPPENSNDYLLAHQGYSPRLSLQGMAPYVRTVSDNTAERAPR